MKRFITQLSRKCRRSILLALCCFSLFDVSAQNSQCNLQLVFAAKHPSCLNENNGTLNAAVRNGTPPYKYLWSTGATTRSLSNLPPGRYKLTATDAKGCTIIDSVELTQPEALKATAKITRELSCASKDGAVTIEAWGGTPPYTYYLGTQLSRTGVFENLSAGKFAYWVLDAKGCQFTGGEMELEGSPSFELSIDVVSQVSCKGADGVVRITADGGTAPFTYSLDNTTNHSGEFEGLAAGFYNCTVTDSKGCTGTATVELTRPEALNVSATITSNVSCKGNNGAVTIVANGNAPFTYVLNGHTNNTGVFTNLAAGKHNYKVIDHKGCEATGTIELIQPASDLNASSIVTAEVTCSGNDGAVKIIATGGKAPYLFHLGGTTNKTGVFTGLKSAKYFYKISDANGCIIPATVQLKAAAQISGRIDVQGLVLSYGGSYFVLPGFGLNTIKLRATGSGGSGGYTYDWGTYGRTATITVRPKTTTTYSVTITDSKGCKRVSSITIIAIAPGCCGDLFTSAPNGSVNEALSTGIDRMMFPSLKVYPNPASQYINIGLDQLSIVGGKAEVSIHDLQGRLVSYKQLNKTNINRIDVSQLKQGMYILHLKVSGQIMGTSKFNIVR